MDSSYQLMNNHVTSVNFTQSASNSMATDCKPVVGWARHGRRFSFLGKAAQNPEVCTLIGGLSTSDVSWLFSYFEATCSKR